MAEPLPYEAPLPHELMEGQHAARDIQQEGNQQCRRRAKQQACRCRAVCKGIDEAFAFKEATCINHTDDTADNQASITGRTRSITLPLPTTSDSASALAKGLLHLGIEIIVRLCISFMLQHRAEVCICDGQCQHCYNTQQCIEVIGDGSDEQLQTIHALNYTGYCRSPGGNGSNDTDREPLFASMIYASFALETLCVSVTGRITRAYGQAVEIVIHEYQNAQGKGERRAPLLVFLVYLPQQPHYAEEPPSLISENKDIQKVTRKIRIPHCRCRKSFCQHTAVCDISENRQMVSLRLSSHRTDRRPRYR